MGAAKRFWNRINPVYAAALATTDTYTVTPTVGPGGGSTYGTYERWRVRFPSANLTTSPTLNISGIAAQLIQKYSGGALSNLAVGDIQAQDHEVWNDGAGHFVLTNPNAVPAAGYAVKALPTSADSVLITDAAAANGAKTALLGTLRNALGLYAFANVGSSGTVNQGFNVPSVTHTGTGTYTVNFGTALPDANYAALMTVSGGSNIAGTVSALTTSNCVVNTFNVASSVVTDSPFTIIVMR